MPARRVTPILNVSSLEDSIAWFEKLGWKKDWIWEPPDFGSVSSGEIEIFLALNSQGGQGVNGTWLQVWVDDVDAVHRRCVEQGLDVKWPPTDCPWNLREMRVRHPDGHVLRIGQSMPEE